jgi:hypothetical protein
MSRLLMAALLSGLALTAAGHVPEASAEVTTRLSCKGSILGFEKRGDERLVSYQDDHGHIIEVWCTRRIFDSQFDLRISKEPPAHDDDGHGDPVAPGRLATVGGCFFDDGDNQGPIIVYDQVGAYAKVEWINMDPYHRRTYRFSYDFSTELITITATVEGCPPASKVLAPQSSYRKLEALLPHPQSAACARGALGNFGPPESSP